MHQPLVVLCLIIASSGEPVQIRSGLNKHLDQHHDSAHLDSAQHKGIANFEGEEGFNRNDENRHATAENANDFSEANAAKKLQADSNSYEDSKFHQAKGANAEDFAKKEASKKGHHKSGYSKSYYKDEGGKTENYYDDDEHEGGSKVEKSKQHSFGDEGAQGQRGQDYNDQKYQQEDSKKGYQRDGGVYEKDNRNRVDYRGKKYRDDRVDEARKNGGRQYGEGGRFNEEKYADSGRFYPNSYNPRKTITIYEDPRYEGFDGSRYPYDDYVQLDVRRPTRGYDYGRSYERAPYPYDYYY